MHAGDVVIFDNLSSHKNSSAAKTLRVIGTWFLFLPPYSPDLNPIRMAFSKPKALIRKGCRPNIRRPLESGWPGLRPVLRRGML
ncbi:ISSpo6, transposase OrfB [Sulfitobacter indolifex HEL-45]|uniref:ISSpo6, transposase OrfB n=1 Tax=Sulfitobacter indolifex HEL-45 TaxID=391624 RepID=A0ABM9X0L5_9RHOB|nr:transposase [Sulfitobacter indolifex]EDQ02990.1 ISSpo6, transposase OrfB [Sulfitobacter indolifex HEL-45]